MNDTVKQLQVIIDTYSIKLKAISKGVFLVKPSRKKWSKQEELGHLVDSAHNNLRRFLVAQYETNPKIIYAQDTWVLANQYQQQEASDIITLWIALNKQILYVLKSMSIETQERMCNTGKEEASLHTIKWLAQDYVKHLLHHLHHILELEPISY